jgi:hypothetical protein
LLFQKYNKTSDVLNSSSSSNSMLIDLIEKEPIIIDIKDTSDGQENLEIDNCEPPSKKIKINNEEFNLKNILSQNVYGQTLLQIHENGNTLSSRCQSILCQIIVAYFLNSNIR